MIFRLLFILCLFFAAVGAANAQTILPSGYLLASGSQITSGTGSDVRMACVNADNSLPTDIQAMRNAGFNCLRYSWWDAKLSGTVSTPGSLLAMDAMVSAATTASMRVIFVHRGNEGSATDGCLKQQKNGLWYDLNGSAPYNQTNNTNGCGTTGTITYSTFRTNWINIATRYNNNQTVIGFDLHHEPLVSGASWSSGNVCANCGTDVSGMCSDVGTAINTVNAGALIICEGPLNNTTKYLNGATLNAVSGTGFTVSDLTMAASSPVSGFPTNKLVYSAHDYPCNVSASCPSSGATATTARNTAWGYLITSNAAPVFIGEVGCSCDNTNGNLTDDNNWATAFTQYANGQNQSQGGTGGPTFTGSQQGLSTAWWDWGNQPTNNPNGILLANGNFNAGQRTFWLLLLYNPNQIPCGAFSADFNNAFSISTSCSQVTTNTSWNPTDKTTNFALSNNNLTATSSASAGASGAVRSTTSKSTGKWCWEVAANTISSNWDVGFSNSSFNLTNPNGLGSDFNGIGFDSNFDLGNSNALGIFFQVKVTQATDGTGDANGAKITMCEDFDAGKFWVTSPRMRALGFAWNDNNTDDPATGISAISTSGLTCPCFITFQDFEAGVGTLNAVGPFAVSLPSGFSTWDAIPSLPGHFLLINLGMNDNYPAANDNVQDSQVSFIPLQKVASR